MAKYKLTRLSPADLESILEYTVRSWSPKQAERYLGDLQAGFQELAERPGIGRACDAIRPGLMRMEHGRHVVFYRRKEYGIRVIRVLHQSMLPDQHLLDDKDNVLFNLPTDRPGPPKAGPERGRGIPRPEGWRV